MKIELEIPDAAWTALEEVCRRMPALGATPEELLVRALEPAVRTHTANYLQLPPTIATIKQQLEQYMTTATKLTIRRLS